MDFLEPILEQYIESRTDREPEVLARLNRETWAKVLVPRMIAGQLQGRAIAMLSHMIQPNQILEIGTYTGYSAICWAEGLQPNGKVHTIDINEELESMIRSYLKEAGVADSVELYVGNALEVIPGINETFDIVYIDADKGNYSNYYDLVFDKVRPGGYIIADNMLWSGKVLEDEENMDEETRGIVEYATKVHGDDRVQNVMLPIRDGLLIARKR